MYCPHLSTKIRQRTVLQCFESNESPLVHNCYKHDLTLCNSALEIAFRWPQALHTVSRQPLQCSTGREHAAHGPNMPRLEDNAPGAFINLALRADELPGEAGRNRRCFCVCLHAALCVCVCVSLRDAYVSMSISMCLCVSLCVSVSFVPLSPSVSLRVSLCASVCLSLCLCLSVSLSIYACVAMHVSSVGVCVALCVSPCVSAPLCVCVCVLVSLCDVTLCGSTCL